MQGVRGSSPRSSTNARDADTHPSPSAGGVAVSEAAETVTETDTTDERTRIERYDPTAIEPRWQARWAELRPVRDGPRRRVEAQVLPAHDVPVSVGRPAHRPLVHRHADGRAGALPADARLQRLLPDRLRCVRPAGRERGDQERRPPVHLDDVEHREHAPPVPDDGRDVRLGRRGRHRRPVVLPLEPVAVPALPGGRASPIARCRPSTGAPTTGRWRASRSRAPTGTAGAAARWSRSATWSSGSCARRRTPTSCSTSTGLDWPEPDPHPCRPTGSAAPRAPRSTSRPRPTTTSPAATALRVFTTRPDTLFGATFMVLAPEHPLVADADPPGPPRRGRGVRRAGAPADRDRPPVDRPREDRRGARRRGHQPGQRRADPDLHRRLRAVRLRHRRDHGRARPRRARLRVRREVRPADPARRRGARTSPPTRRWTTPTSPTPPTSGWSTAAGSTACRPTRAARRSWPSWPRPGSAEPKVTYRLRDWLISRQRYWGTPIPVIYCPSATASCRSRTTDLPVRLPETVDYKGSGDNPLNHDEAFLQHDLPACGGPARRETDTMDTFIDSSWYWFRYLSPGQDGRPGRPRDGRALDAGRPVHGRRRARGHAPDVRALLHQGDGRPRPGRPSASRSCGCSTRARSWAPTASGCRKSRGNVQDPDELVARYGADTVRLFLMFMGPWDQGGPWSPTGIGGVHRFLNRVWTLALDPHGREPGDPDAGTLPAGETEADAAGAIRAAAHRTLRDVTADYEAFRFNTMVAKLMELTNTLFRYRGTVVAGTPAWDEAIRLLLLMLAPAAPHITEELWSAPRWPRPASRGRSIHTAVVARGRRRRDRRGDPRGPGPGQRQAARPGDGPGRHRRRRRSRRRPWPPEDRGGPRRAGRRTASSTPAAAGSSTSSSATEGQAADMLARVPQRIHLVVGLACRCSWHALRAGPADRRRRGATPRRRADRVADGGRLGVVINGTHRAAASGTTWRGTVRARLSVMLAEHRRESPLVLTICGFADLAGSCPIGADGAPHDGDSVPGPSVRCDPRSSTPSVPFRCAGSPRRHAALAIETSRASRPVRQGRH